ncbi:MULTISPECIES: bifunctional riboflavin kinase/FAD synthetase [unclassified Thermosipho (in: thermotogales)]|uniref:bifunctional riboflavin kinase/FAD synthetase n=1 Tax=unclassified Thermosipho (in: thermotogales) TaxID=2676525 RepID=UPI00094925B1|nr:MULTISPECIES: bifunctional riboflavin kinase/FAD synthetase [unclassified Thermosipho (in: thermotogales)]ANQ53467.1 riboflavin biosynthesis protein RibF [Thermosipho sp. 1070]
MICLRVLTIGVFDGVHIGHVKILNTLKKMAETFQSKPEIYTIVFPMEYYTGKFDGLLIPLEDRITLLELYGDVFTLNLEEIKNIEAKDFFEFLSKNTTGIVVGKDFRFGRNAKGDIKLLEKLSKEEGIKLKIVDDLIVDGKRVSSTLIRKLIKEGKVKKANKLLGRAYPIYGRIYKDKQLGKKLGFPTANIRRGKELIIPKFGVYLCRVYTPKRYYGLINIGLRPTIEKTKNVKYEVYILDFEGNLYGKEIRVELLDFLREEKNFSSIDELIKQMHEDKKIARKILEREYEY